MTGIVNCTENGLELDSHRSMTYSVVYGCILALGFPLNAVSLWILVRRHRIKSPSAVFMINLALSDLLLVISLPMRVYFYATGSWPQALGRMGCTWFTMLFRNNIRSGAIFITFIGVDRLLAVVYPLRFGLLRTTTNAWRACALVWVFIVAANIPESVRFIRTLESRNETACFVIPLRVCGVEQREMPVIDYFWLVVVFTMLAVNVVSTAMVYWTLRRHLNDSARINNKVNVMLIFAMNLLMFVICFMPLGVVVMVKWRSAIEPTTCLCSVNCCIDPLLYYFSLDAFWKKQEKVDASLTREQLATVGEE